jgi:subtilisin family serine protease
MRRLSAVLLVLFAATTAFAQEQEPAQLKGARERLGRAMILNPAEPLSAERRAALEAQGIKVGQPLAGGRFVARVREQARLDVVDAGTLEPLTLDHKIARSARQAVGHGRTWAHVKVYFHRDVDFDDARAAIFQAGGALPDPFRLRFSPARRLDATIAPHALEALAADERVMVVTGARKLRVESHNLNSARVSNVTPLFEAPYGLSGEGVTLSLFEIGAAQSSHPEFQGRFTVHFDSGDGDHSTHVAGTIAAAGINANAKGMAPKAQLHEFCVASDGGNLCDNNWLDDKDLLLEPLGVAADNNSWGFVLGWCGPSHGCDTPVWLDSAESMGGYDIELGTPALDEISILRNVLFIHSAGNDGDGQTFPGDSFAEHHHVDAEGETMTDKVFCYSKNASGTDCPTSCNGGCEAARHDPKLPFDTMGATAAAKNVIAVGAVTASGSFVGAANFTSRGPAKDGRVKPDVVARGVGVTSTIPTSTYAVNQGTSMASPVVTGIAGLLVEQWRRTFGAGSNPKPEQLKALIIAGAQDLGNPGPDYTFGFGLVDAKASVDTIIADGGTGQRIRTLNFTQAAGQEIESTITLTAAQNLRIVLNWPDPPVINLGDDDPGFKTLVNDLDVRVIDPAGVTHRPYVLNKDAHLEPATRGVNTVDNVEMLEIPNAGPGQYRVLVTGKSVPERPQTAVLVASATLAGEQPPPPPPCVDPMEAGRTNDTAQTAIANLSEGQSVLAALCTDVDVDFYTFTATQAGPVSVSVTARDTALFVTLTGALPIEVPANTTRTIASVANGAPSTFTLSVTALADRGINSQYEFTPEFGTADRPRRRSVRR